MQPVRKRIIKGYKIEEYYWNDNLLVYVNNKFVGKYCFDEICKKLEGKR